MNFKAPILLLVAATFGLQGCASICDDIIETEMQTRNMILAQKAWGHWSWCYDDLDFPYHFARGFKAGYRDVLDGGSGCQPTLPPKCYWKPCFQTPEGRCKTHAWFDGFSHGALAARQDGYGSLGEIPISPRARENLRLANSRPAQPMAFIETDSMSPTPVGDNELDLTSPPETGTGDVAVPLAAPATNSTRPYDE